MEENVRFLGQISNVPQLLTKAKVFALSSLTEGLPMSVIEAMAAGKPTVVTDVGGNGELVVEGETGFLVSSGDAKVFAEKICILLKDKTLAKRMGANGKRRVDSKFSQERMIRYYENVYKTLLYCES
jgi:glycosyltransferase involved in cell wall biosynthesis